MFEFVFYHFFRFGDVGLEMTEFRTFTLEFENICVKGETKEVDGVAVVLGVGEVVFGNGVKGVYLGDVCDVGDVVFVFTGVMH